MTSAYKINGHTGALTALTGSPFSAGSNPYDISIDPAGGYAYVTDYGSGEVSAYSINPTSGALSAVSGSPFTATAPYGIGVDSTGKFAYVANLTASGISEYLIGNGTGTLSSAGPPFYRGQLSHRRGSRPNRRISLRG